MVRKMLVHVANLQGVAVIYIYFLVLVPVIEDDGNQMQGSLRWQTVGTY